MKYIDPEKWEPCDIDDMEEAAIDAVKSKENTLVIAGPGAGKTEMLAQKATFLLRTNTCVYPQKILALCFKTDAASNLKDRVVKRCGDDATDRFVSMTYAAFAKSLLDQYYKALPLQCQPSRDYTIGEDFNIRDKVFEQSGYIRPLGWNINQLKGDYKRLLAIDHFPFNGSSIEEKAWRLLLKGNGTETIPAHISFEMITLLALYILRSNVYIKKTMQATYSHIFLDEFQDTTALQYNFVKEMFLGSRSLLTAVGDNKQSIMLWAGAYKGIFKDYYDDFKAEGKRLLMNHRSAPKLIELQKRMYALLNETYTQITPSKKWKPNDGEVKLFLLRDDDEEAIYIANDISAKIQNGTRINDICILGKQHVDTYSQKIIDALSSKGILARVENEYQDLLKEPIVKIFENLFLVAIDERNPDAWNFVVNELAAVKGLETSGDAEQYYQWIEELNQEISEIKKMMISCQQRDHLERLVNRILDYIESNHIKAFYPAYKQGNRLNDVTMQFVELFIKDLEKAKFDWKMSVSQFEGKNSIPIMTIHKSKGLEYSAVYFIGLEDSAFWNFRNQPDEDRCSFFVALSRAKEFVSFSFCEVRNNLRFPQQRRNNIKEFFDILQQPGMANIINMCGGE
jgi:superfamily I DNA/RNA helicase